MLNIVDNPDTAALQRIGTKRAVAMMKLWMYGCRNPLQRTEAMAQVNEARTLAYKFYGEQCQLTKDVDTAIKEAEKHAASRDANRPAAGEFLTVD
jgi:hypothetical protein